MRISIVVSRQANFFFFLSNLSLWHYSCNPLYNQVWISATGSLRKVERQHLQRLQTLLQRHRFGDATGQRKYLGYYFQAMPEEAGWLALKKVLSSRDWITVRKAWDCFEPRFTAIWSDELRRLQRAAGVLLHDIDQPNFRPLYKDLGFLFNKNTLPASINIVLLMRPTGLPANVGGGHANLGTDSIALEAGDLTMTSTRRRTKMRGIFFHEVAHAFFARPRFERQLASWLRHDPASAATPSHQGAPSFRSWVYEGILSSLIPQGILAQKYLGIDIEEQYRRYFLHASNEKLQQRTLSMWRVFAAYHLAPIMTRYLRRHRSMNRPLVDTTVTLLSLFRYERPEALKRLRPARTS